MADLVDSVRAFELQNTVRIKLRAELTTVAGVRDLVWTAEAYDNRLESPGQLPLAYANVKCLGSRLARMEAVLFQLLYALDFQLASAEMEGKEPE